MIRVIARKECLEIARDGRFRLGAGIIAVLLLASLATGWRQHRDVGAQHARAQAATREHWVNQPAKDPHSAAHYGIYAFKPRLPLSLIDSGVDPYTGVAAWLEAHKQNEFQFRPAQDRSAVVRFGELTAAASLQWLVPILIVLLAADAFAGEREHGTLRQVLSAGVRPRTLALGKLAGVGIAIAVVAVPAAVVGAIALVWAGGGSGLWGGRALALAGVYFAWFLLVANVALAVSAAARSVRQALAVLFVCWAVNVLVAPRVATEIARRLHPTPTAFAFAQDVQRSTYEGLDVHRFLVQRARTLKARLLSTYQVTRLEDLPVNFRGIDYLEREAAADATFDEAYGRVWAAFDRQGAMQQRAAIVAPLLAVRSLSMAAAATDAFHHRRFAQAAEAYRRRLVRAMNENLAFASTHGAGGGYQAAPDLWASLPPFTYEAPTLGAALSAQRTSLTALAGWLVASAVALAVAVSRMRVA